MPEITVVEHFWQAFATLFERIDDYHDEGERFGQWLLQIARNAAWKHLRHSRRLRPTDPLELDRHREALAQRGAPP